jgi:hypothetical protein
MHISKYLSEMLNRFPNMEEEYVSPGMEHDQLFEATYNHEGGKTCRRCDRNIVVEHALRKNSAPRIHYGTIGSANEVIIFPGSHLNPHAEQPSAQHTKHPTRKSVVRGRVDDVIDH